MAAEYWNRLAHDFIGHAKEGTIEHDKACEKVKEILVQDVTSWGVIATLFVALGVEVVLEDIRSNADDDTDSETSTAQIVYTFCWSICIICSGYVLLAQLLRLHIYTTTPDRQILIFLENWKAVQHEWDLTMLGGA
eukprot:m.68516 g.68516  ORF g.68516 m.68516 type:complete len:136 (+) comp23964_c0_seq1:94-501(+)